MPDAVVLRVWPMTRVGHAVVQTLYGRPYAKYGMPVYGFEKLDRFIAEARMRGAHENYDYEVTLEGKKPTFRR